jgi:hypothetical protein
MGDCDRMYQHISAYLENTLDPATRAEYENNLEKYPALKMTTQRVSELTVQLGTLPQKQCSEDFVGKLRQKINSDAPVQQLAAGYWKKYSLAFSSIVILCLAVWMVYFYLLKGESPVPPLAPQGEFQTDPATVAGPAVPAPLQRGDIKDIDIKTRDESRIVQDSSLSRKIEQDNSRAKQVGHSTNPR